jgi:sugar O-acyltransferase (sialic acid O-acetyltransferase NeuD family)
MKKLVIFGAANFAELAHYYFTQDSPYAVAAFTVDARYAKESAFRGLPVVAFEEVAKRYPPDGHDLFVAVGLAGLNKARAAKVAEAEAKGYRLAGFLSSKAEVSPELEVPPNSMVMEHSTIQPFVRIGRDTMIWSGTGIGFGTRVGDHCWIVAARFGESVTVGDYSFIGLNATIAPGVAIGASNVIGAGALIVNSTRDLAVYRGQASAPSRVPSTRLKGIFR